MGCYLRYLIAEPAQGLEMVIDAALYGLWIDRFPILDESYPLVQNVPHDPAKSVGDGPDGLQRGQDAVRVFSTGVR